MTHTDDAPLLDALRRRRSFFDRLLQATGEDARYATCPCCGLPALTARGRDERCPICAWHDDGQDDADADAVRGGPNGVISLTDARRLHARRLEAGGAPDADEDRRPPVGPVLARMEALAELLGTRALTGHHDDDALLAEWDEIAVPLLCASRPRDA